MLRVIKDENIPEWLQREVDEYFVPLPFVPSSILDIGANIGAFAKAAGMRWPSARMICCEPMPFNVSRLRRHAPPHTIIISAAVRDQNGIDEIFLGDNFVTSGFVQFGRQTSKRLTVECVAAGGLPSCELVKIDTEGSELEIVRNLDLTNTRAIWLEYHSEADSHALRGLLEPNYQLCRHVARGNLGILSFLKAPLEVPTDHAGS